MARQDIAYSATSSKGAQDTAYGALMEPEDIAYGATRYNV
jgi:hypothetical protein